MYVKPSGKAQLEERTCVNCKETKKKTEYSKKQWKDDIDDVLYTFESRPHKILQLYMNKGVIVKIKRL